MTTTGQLMTRMTTMTTTVFLTPRTTMMIMTAFPTMRTLREDPAPTHLALATAAPGAPSSSSLPPSSYSSATASPRRSSTRRGRLRRKRKRRRARRKRPKWFLHPAPTQKSSPCRHSKNHPKQAVPHPNLPAADVVLHLGRVRLDDVDLHVEASTPPLMYKRRHPP